MAFPNPIRFDSDTWLVMRNHPVLPKAVFRDVHLCLAGLAIVAVTRSSVAPLLPFITVLGPTLSWAAGNVIARKAKAASGLALWSGPVLWSRSPLLRFRW